jgi:preprotein translocase subunit SecG
MVFLVILLIILCIALGLFVLIQNPKGGGLATGGSGSNMFGVQRTGDVLEKGTWVLLTLIVVFSLAVTAIGKSGTAKVESKMDQQVEKQGVPSPIGNSVPAKSTSPIPAPTDTTKK